MSLWCLIIVLYLSQCFPQCWWLYGEPGLDLSHPQLCLVQVVIWLIGNVQELGELLAIMCLYVYLTALGQVMLYVDGMNGVINHNATIQWLYSLLASKVSIPILYPRPPRQKCWTLMTAWIILVSNMWYSSNSG